MTPEQYRKYMKDIDKTNRALEQYCKENEWKTYVKYGEPMPKDVKKYMKEAVKNDPSAKRNLCHHR
jgi:acyl-CoA synthetase (AMP-forming)/AMP-acid ligase II